MILQVSAASAITAKDHYFNAEACYYKLKKDKNRQRYRHNWLTCIKKFKIVYREHPSDPWAPAGMYMAGKMFWGLYRNSYRKSDKEKTLNILRRITKLYPKSRYKHKASEFIRTIKNKNESAADSQNNKRSGKTQQKITRTTLQHKKKIELSTTVTGIRYWSTADYTRVVIDTDRKTSFFCKLLKKDAVINKPRRLYIDLGNSEPGHGLKKFTPINNNLLRDVRTGRFKPDVVRVVLEIKSLAAYKIFSLKNPFRIVIDIDGSSDDLAVANKDLKKEKHRDSNALRILVDPGHGGRDLGSAGYLKNVYEKNINLQIAKKLVKKIEKELNCEAALTHNCDRFITLEGRAAMANIENADLLISIHSNGSKNQNIYGIETYFLNLATDNGSITVAARENSTSTKNISDLQSILTELMQNTKIDESRRLAGLVQSSLCNHMGKHYQKIRNRGVKQAPFYVLLGARMPAILVQASFLSNPRECRRLTNLKYQDNLCEGIVKGIRKYITISNSFAQVKKFPDCMPDRKTG
jgi:N-acetylmuramoyl-L-alanine amidase